MEYHVLCGINDDDNEFPVSIFMEREGKDPIYICCREDTDIMVMKYLESLHYKDYDEAIVKWPILEKMVADTNSLDI